MDIIRHAVFLLTSTRAAVHIFVFCLVIAYVVAPVTLYVAFGHIDENVRASLPRDISVSVIHNSFAANAAIAHFADNRDEVARMGRNARQLAHANFDPVKNSRALLEVYRNVTRTTRSAWNCASCAVEAMRV